MEKKMQNELETREYIGVNRDNGKENGNYYLRSWVQAFKNRRFRDEDVKDLGI